MKTLGVIKEMDALETRVALTPEIVTELIKKHKLSLAIESGAGIKAGYADEAYKAAGATIYPDFETVIEKSHYITAVLGTALCQIPEIAHKVVISLFDPYFHKEAMKKACTAQATLISLELIPRISRAQSMDVLSSQANIAGYVSILLVAHRLGKIIPLMMTAAGTIKPAKILIIGAGVLGLQAIATAKRLGAVVFAYDVRSVVKEQVESLGAKFVDIKIEESAEGGGGYAKALSKEAENRLREKLALFAKDMDAIVTTAQIPGRKAPLLLDESVFSTMKPDSVIVDMAAGSGGNVAGSVVHEWVRKENVWLYGADNLARLKPKDASFTFSKNISALLDLIFLKENLDFDDEIMRDAVICHQGRYVNQGIAALCNQVV